MDMELHTVRTNGNDGAAYNVARAEEPDGRASRTQDPSETEGLLSIQTSECNGDVMTSSQVQEAQGNVGNAEKNIMSTMKRQMNQVVYKKVKLWMVIVSILVVIALLIIFSLFVCSAIHEDVDEKFDRSLFQVPLCFNGSFHLPNMVFAEDLFHKSQTLVSDLKEKLTALFKSSPALGRYFSAAEINRFRNVSVIADYQLTFFMPKDEQDQLRNFTLSREMVYNVFRQFLYDQDSDPAGLIYINSTSLRMFEDRGNQCVLFSLSVM